jgi:hypothetical protein
MVALVGEIDKLLQSQTVATDAQPARSLLSQLAGKLQVHLTMEDKNMYPRLLTNANTDVAVKAKKFVDEMGTISQEFKKYTDRWPSAMVIQEQPDTFIAETRSIFKTLANRIKKEESELYPMVDF